MADIRATFLATVADLQPLVAKPEVGDRWDQPSVLERMTVGALAAHLVRGASTVDTYLDGDEPEGEVALTPTEYFGAAVPDRNLDSDMQRGVRERAAEAAAAGQQAVVNRLAELHERLSARLAAESEERRLRVFGGMVIRLDDYLETRLVELVVHADDLAVSVDLEPPRLPLLATTAVIETLVWLPATGTVTLRSFADSLAGNETR